MPIYEYQCSQCGKTIDVLQKIDDPAPSTCAECGAESSLKRKVSRTSFVLKGGGWYADLYGTPKKEEKKESTNTGESAKPAPSKPSSDDSGSGGGTPGPSAAAAAAPTK